MAVIQNVLKLTQTHGVVAVRGTDASSTIALATTLKKSTETQSSPKVDIKAIHWSLGAAGVATITRNSVVLYDLAETGTLEFHGFSDNHLNTNDIVVAITNAGSGTVIVECAKLSGYGSQQHQNQGDLG